MTISANSISIAPPSPADTVSLSSLPPCTIQWQPGRLLVSCLSSTENLDRDSIDLALSTALDCLYHPEIRSIELDPHLGERGLQAWAQWGRFACKPAFVRFVPPAESPPQRHPYLWRAKRMLDSMAAAFLLLVLAPVLAAIALLIRWDSPGTIWFQQWRVGEGGKLFRMVKFRTMTEGSEKLHHQIMGDRDGLHKQPDDPRITRVGRWLRKFSLDELPQLFNVLRGEMSLVGPRPWALYDALRIDRSGQSRLHALPGMTGSWQVEGRSNVLDLEAVTQRDLRYLETWSIGQDLKILFLTIPKVFSGLGAH